MELFDSELKVLDEATKAEMFFGKLRNTYLEFYAVAISDGKKYGMIDKFYGEKLAHEGFMKTKDFEDAKYFKLCASDMHDAFLSKNIDVTKLIKKNLDNLKLDELYFCVVKILTVSEPIYDN